MKTRFLTGGAVKRCRKWLVRVGCMLLALAIGALPLAAQRGAAPSPTPQAGPAENLLIIVADIQRHLNDDLYQYNYPTDALGQNLFRASLVRLANYEALYAGRNEDIVAMAKGQAFEKMTAYPEAAENYDKAAKSSDAKLARLAAESASRVRSFERAVNAPIDQAAMRTYERDLQALIERTGELAQQYRNTPAASLARIEQERADLTLAEFYVSVRFVQPFTTDLAITTIKANIEKHKESKNRYTHRLMLGDLYYRLAQEYAALHDPDGSGFSLKAFEGYTNLARAEYFVVQQADGFPEKLEGRAKLAALEAFVERIRERGR